MLIEDLDIDDLDRLLETAAMNGSRLIMEEHETVDKVSSAKLLIIEPAIEEIVVRDV